MGGGVVAEIFPLKGGKFLGVKFPNFDCRSNMVGVCTTPSTLTAIFREQDIIRICAIKAATHTDELVGN